MKKTYYYWWLLHYPFVGLKESMAYAVISHIPVILRFMVMDIRRGI